MCLEVTRNARYDRFHKQLDDVGVIGMNRVTCVPAVQFFQCPTAVLLQLGVDAFYFARRRRERKQARDAVDVHPLPACDR